MVLGLVFPSDIVVGREKIEAPWEVSALEQVTPQRRNIFKTSKLVLLESQSHDLSLKKIRLLRKSLEQVRKPLELGDFLLATWILPREGSYFLNPL